MYGRKDPNFEEVGETEAEESDDELDCILNPKKKTKNEIENVTSKDLLQILKKEMCILELTSERPAHLEKLYQALLTIRPSSIEAERVFSSANLFVTKLRNKMSDSTLDNLVFLRSHFMNKWVE